MGFFLQIVGVILAFSSLIIGIVVVNTGTKSYVPVILFVIALTLFFVGRKINNYFKEKNNEKYKK